MIFADCRTRAVFPIISKKPASFLRLGNGVNSAILHSAKYDFADDSLTVGAALWAVWLNDFSNGDLLRVERQRA